VGYPKSCLEAAYSNQGGLAAISPSVFFVISTIIDMIGMTWRYENKA